MFALDFSCFDFMTKNSVNFNTLPRSNRLDALRDVLARARELGFDGFGGACWTAAVAINRVLLGGLGTYTVGVNAALERADYLLGHAAVTIEDEDNGFVHIDADGRIKGDDELEAYGQLDPEDSDWLELAQSLGVLWGDEQALQAARFDVDEDDLLQNDRDGIYERQVAALRSAAVELGYLEVQASSPSP